MFEFNSINDSKFKYNEKVRFEFDECSWIKMSLPEMSILSCDNNSLATSVWFSLTAHCNGVLLNVRVQFYKGF